MLITLLTSSNIEHLKASYQCVINLQPCETIDHDVYIVVNTLNYDYYKNVIKSFPTANIIRTDSNGRPGKGHNSLLTLFKNKTEYDYLLPVDGDDFLYPNALNRLELYLKYNPDLLFLPYTDTLTPIFPGVALHCSLLDKCYITFTQYLKNIREIWYDGKQSPFVYNINNCNTPGRLALCSRKALNMDLSYDEDMKWFDDFNLFLQAFDETVVSNNYNIFMIEETNIYLYNRLNEDSVSAKFLIDKEKKAREEEIIFRNSVYNKFLAIRSWDLKNLLFLKADDDPTFTIRHKINFCEKLISELDLKSIVINKSSFEKFINYARENNFSQLEQIYK